MRALLVPMLLLGAILFYNRPSASRARNLAAEFTPPAVVVQHRASALERWVAGRAQQATNR